MRVNRIIVFCIWCAVSVYAVFNSNFKIISRGYVLFASKKLNLYKGKPGVQRPVSLCQYLQITLIIPK